VIKYLQLPFHFDAKRMQQELYALEKADPITTGWKLHYQVLHYEGEWSALPLRSVSGKTDDVVISPVDGAEYHDTELLQQCPYMKEVLDHFQCPLLAVRLLKLKAGSVIREHSDAELHFEKGEIRIHIPVKTNEQVEFYLDNEKMTLKEGECWYMNFNLRHRISNNSKEDRIHLVIDAVANDWVKDLFTGNSVKNKKEISENDLLDEKTKREMIAHLRSMNTETGNRLADELEKR
jgi:hypothetical protein